MLKRMVKTKLLRYGFRTILCFLIIPISCKKKEYGGMATPESFVYVANQNDQTISVIDAGKNKVVCNISLEVGPGEIMMPHNVQASPDGKTLWATVNAMDFTVKDQVVVIDPRTNKIIEKIEIGKAVHVAHVILDDESEYAYATATDSNFIVKINAKTYAIEKKIPLGCCHRPHGLRYNNGRLFVANMMSETAAIIDVNTYQITEIPLGGMAMQAALTKDGNKAFFSLNDMKSIAVYDLLKDSLYEINLPGSAKGPVQIALTPDDKNLFICDQGLLGNNASDLVFVMDVMNNIITDSIKAGKAAHGIVINPAGTRGYVSNSTGNSVSVINIKEKNVICNVPVGALPVGITYWTDTGY
jgi:YVTN family beta-propeller protein